ncbi:MULTISPECIES: arylamine N-acetyltransferase [Kitasatospora]|uniref:Putative acetyltransferase n=1 Tax=Kitasatospora setae (strain ATCC 33774 / DSM 43861 / JCM 3304 / KCC A-0304 / NBRC 14216 / KM-6054) TaxID=452652 RepID=E4N0J6_KITSK|nr:MULTISPECIES: arylamine N-acetyltransferase [Kitasatospora]BAJ31680.1 putative acetyltransferase [Kitasatospora setae KM-6054]
MPSDTLVDAYLTRIGATRPARPDAEALAHLQERAVLSVPFENLDYHLEGREIVMDERVLDKIALQHRGGGCYEVNPALGFVLTALGYQVEIIPGRVHRPDGLGPLLGHLALRVTIGERVYLVDTGFGRNSRRPLDFTSREVQQDPHGAYQLVDTEGRPGTVDVLLDGRPLYQVQDTPVRIEDYAPTLWWYRTSPDSSFLQGLFCSVRTETGLVTLKGRHLNVVDGDSRTKTVLTDDADLLAAYKTHFGISLDVLPTEPTNAVTTGVRTD